MNQGGRHGRGTGTAPMAARPMMQQPQQPQGAPQQGPPQQGAAAYDAAMMPTQNAQLNLEGWDPQTSAGRGGLAWTAIVLCGWMALVRLVQGGLGLVLTAAAMSGGALGASILSFVAAAFYVWATIGLYKQTPKAYRAVLRVNGFLAVLGLISTFLAFAGTGMNLSTIVNLVGVAFHLLALLITYAARDNLGNEWSS